MASRKRKNNKNNGLFGIMSSLVVCVLLLPFLLICGILYVIAKIFCAILGREKKIQDMTGYEFEEYVAEKTAQKRIYRRECNTKERRLRGRHYCVFSRGNFPKKQKSLLPMQEIQQAGRR